MLWDIFVGALLCLFEIHDQMNKKQKHRKDLTLSEQKKKKNISVKAHTIISVKEAVCSGYEMGLQLPDKPKPEALGLQLEDRNVKLSFFSQRVNI